jgi:hypothetical protein
MTLLSDDQWLELRELAQDGNFPCCADHIYKVQAGKRTFSEKMAIQIHIATQGRFACWDLRPWSWEKGQMPPAIREALP